ncbi:MAG: hypothetical protein ACTHM6_00770 [Tepidisphaeraceae bacterium]
MTNSLATARAAISAEIKHLASEQAKLERVLAQLDSGRAVGVVAPGAKRRGRPPLKAKPQGGGDISEALALIEGAGKKGMKALKLAHQLKQTGGYRPSKSELLESNKVKMVGTGGGSTYIWIA